MKIDFNKTNETMFVAIEGRLDAITAPDFESFIDENYDGACPLILDCKDLAYVSSAGLRVLLGAQKKAKGAMKLTNVCELVIEVFEMTGFDDIFTVE